MRNSPSGRPPAVTSPATAIERRRDSKIAVGRALTPKSVAAAPPDPAGRYELPDPALSGLYLIVQPTGAKSWALRYRCAGRTRKLTLGSWPLMELAEARMAASAAIEAIESGQDPAAEKQAAKAAQAQITEQDRVKTLIGQFERRHLAGLKSGAAVQRQLDLHVVPEWGERDIHAITKRDVIDLIDGIADSGRLATANRLRAYLSRFFTWCVERDVLKMSPAAGVKPVAREVSRDRVLSDDELRWFRTACAALGFPWGPFGLTLLLTAQRLSEVARMSDVEIEGGVWSLSAERTKNGRAHDVPLSQAAAEVLAGVTRILPPEGNAPFIFTTTGETPVNSFHKGRGKIAAKMAEIAAEERGEPVEIPHWTFHDLRRTAATGMARLGVPVRVTEAVLNHVSGTGGGIVGIYQRYEYAAEKRQALEAWARHVMALGGKAAGNVVPLHADLTRRSKCEQSTSLTAAPTDALRKLGHSRETRIPSVASTPPRLVPAATVREICGGISDTTLSRWCATAELGFPHPAYVAGRRYWREAEVLGWLERRFEVRTREPECANPPREPGKIL